MSKLCQQKSQICKNKSFFKMPVTFVINKIFQFFFNFLKDNRILF